MPSSGGAFLNLRFRFGPQTTDPLPTPPATPPSESNVVGDSLGTAGQIVGASGMQASGQEYRAVRSGNLRAAKSAAAASRAFGYAGLGISFLQFGGAFAKGDGAGMAKAGVDFGMGLIGFCGPVGAAASSGYFVADTAVGCTAGGWSGVAVGVADTVTEPIVNGAVPMN